MVKLSKNLSDVRRALEFYANDDNWTGTICCEGPQRAKEALEALERWGKAFE